jgi:hypothetical protein
LGIYDSVTRDSDNNNPSEGEYDFIQVVQKIEDFVRAHLQQLPQLDEEDQLHHTLQKISNSSEEGVRSLGRRSGKHTAAPQHAESAADINEIADVTSHSI